MFRDYAGSGLKSTSSDSRDAATYVRLWKRYTQALTHDTYVLAGPPKPGGRKIDEVVFASQKVMMYDSQQRHTGKRDLFFAYPEATQSLVFFDGSVSTRKTADANAGCQPNNAQKPKSVLEMTYEPDLGFESPVFGDPTSKLHGYYRWARQDIAGIDYGGGDSPLLVRQRVPPRHPRPPHTRRPFRLIHMFSDRASDVRQETEHAHNDVMPLTRGLGVHAASVLVC